MTSRTDRGPVSNWWWTIDRWFLASFLVLMVLGIVWIKQRNRLEEKKLSSTSAATAERAAQYASHVQELEDRVRVLERIVTDRGYDVATQIEALRDQRRVEKRLESAKVEETI